MKMYLVGVNLFNLKQKRIAYRDSADLDGQDPDDIVEQILNEDSSLLYYKLDGEDLAGDDNNVCRIWVPEEAVNETMIYKEILVFEDQDFEDDE
jgi:hypothetical protein